MLRCKFKREGRAVIPIKVTMVVTIERHWEGQERGFSHDGDDQGFDLGSGHTGTHLCFVYFSACGLYYTTTVWQKGSENYENHFGTKVLKIIPIIPYLRQYGYELNS